MVRRLRRRQPQSQERHLLAEGLQQGAAVQVRMDDGETCGHIQTDSERRLQEGRAMRRTISGFVVMNVTGFGSYWGPRV